MVNNLSIKGDVFLLSLLEEYFKPVFPPHQNITLNSSYFDSKPFYFSIQVSSRPDSPRFCKEHLQERPLD